MTHIASCLTDEASMNEQDALSVAILRRHGFRIIGHADLLPLTCTTLSDDEIVTVMRALSLGLDPCVDLAAHAITEEVWRSRRHGRRLACEVDPERRRIRKLKKRRHRHR
jgi:hypothetical protein